ncbi:MAG: DCC1-like thiol-disulfide oxidoreductase [Chloroflexota bacterium]
MGLTGGAGSLVVLYDGECSFCRWAVAHLRRWDAGPRGRRAFELLPLAEAPGSAHDHVRAAAGTHDLAEALTVVDPRSGEVARGGDAILAIAVRLPGGGAVRPWLGVTPFRRAVRLLYAAVAANRDLLVRLGFFDGRGARR